MSEGKEQICEEAMNLLSTFEHEKLSTSIILHPRDVEIWLEGFKRIFERYQEKYGNDIVEKDGVLCRVNDLELGDPKFEGSIIRLTINIKEGKDV